MTCKLIGISLLLSAFVVTGGGCFPDPPECVGSNPCPDGDGEVDEVDDSETSDDVTLPDLEPGDGDIGEVPDETSTVETDTEADETSVEADAVEDSGTAESTLELPEAEATDTDTETEVQVDAEVETETGPEVDYKECDDLECELEFRECIEGVAATDARCGDCLDDYRLSGGECVAILTCADLACGAANRECIERNGDIDASCGNCQAGYRLSGNSCIAVLTCDVLVCETDNRDCTEGSGTIDAVCSNCLPGYSLVGTECLASAPAPSGVSATTSNAVDVVITWQGVANANGYDVYRCDLPSCGSGAAGWFALNDVPVLDLTFIDDTVAVPSLPAAPGGMSASTNDGAKVTVTWGSVTVPDAKSYRYRVVAVSDAGDSPASQAVLGQVGNRPVTGYELAIDGGAWTNIGMVTTRDDVDAPAPTITPSLAGATQGAHEGFVRLSATAASVANGATRQYAVRATTALGPGPSASASGNRPAGTLTTQWERSSGSNAENYSQINGATGLSYDDTGAPADGATRWYRLVASASGAGSQPSNEVAGSRLNPASLVPTGVSASTNRASDVEIRWNTVSGATGYSVYRCDLANCSGGGWSLLNASATASTSYIDSTVEVPAAPAAPTVTATTDRTDNVLVSWNSITVGVAKTYTYRVVAQSGSGPSAPSSHVVGSVLERPVTGYEYQIDGGSWTFTGDTQLTDTNAPAATLSTPTASATQGTVAGQVTLTSDGSTITPGANRAYQVRATRTIGPGVAGGATGRRVATGLQYQWQRSASTTNSNFTSILGATTASAADTLATGANASGATRYYRLQVTATGAVTVVSNAVVGTVLAAPTAAPGGLAASTSNSDFVQLSWDSVAGASEYRISRDGTLIATVNATSHQDSGITKPAPWGAPTNVTATNTPTHVQLNWTIPAKPADSSANYSVVAANAAGAGPAATAIGKLVPLPITNFKLEHITNGVTSTVDIPGATTTTYNHISPAGSIGGTLSATASQGDHRAHVKLTATETSIGAIQGVVVTHRIAVVTSGGTGTYSSSVNGNRTVGTITRQWSRSQGATNANYDIIQGATAVEYNDALAPSDGSRRWYTLTYSANGAASTSTAATSGWRLSFVDVAAGGIFTGFTCAITPFEPDGGRVWCWGNNTLGELGRATTGGPLGPGRVQTGASPSSMLEGVTSLAAGHGHVCAVRSDNSLWCWGWNSSGQLGNSSTTNSNTAIQVPLANVGAVSVGSANTCAILTTGEVRCWGENLTGQLGIGTSDTNIHGPEPVKTTPSTSLQGVTSLAIGDGLNNDVHVCATVSGSGLWCWGSNGFGQLAKSTATQFSYYASEVAGASGIAQVGAGIRFNCARTSTNRVKCWGENSNGNFGDGTTGTVDHLLHEAASTSTAQKVTVGATHVCAQLVDGTAKCWGSAALGNGTTSSSTPIFVKVASGSNLTGVQAISASSLHTCVVSSGSVSCWGNNSTQGLGDGTSTYRDNPVEVLLP